MNPKSITGALNEPERYELDAPPPYHFELDRRDFFKTLGGGVAVFLVLKPNRAFPQSREGFSRFQRQLPQNLGAWLHIAPDGAVTVYTGKAEMGQNIRTSLTQAVAGELRAPMGSIALVMADTELRRCEKIPICHAERSEASRLVLKVKGLDPSRSLP